MDRKTELLAELAEGFRTNPLERYNAPDTLKCQQTFRLTAGHCLYSDMGRIFCSVRDMR